MLEKIDVHFELEEMRSVFLQTSSERNFLCYIGGLTHSMRMQENRRENAVRVKAMMHSSNEGVIVANDKASWVFDDIPS